MYSGLESVLIVAAVILAYIIIRVKGEEAGAKKEGFLCLTFYKF